MGMEQFLIDVWKILVTAALGVIGWQWREGHAMKSKISVIEKDLADLHESVKSDKEDVEKSVRHLQENVAKDIDNIKRDIEKIQNRQDGHSRKQDEIVRLISDFKVEVVENFGELSSNLKALNSTIKAYDDLLRVIRKKKGD